MSRDPPMQPDFPQEFPRGRISDDDDDDGEGGGDDDGNGNGDGDGNVRLFRFSCRFQDMLQQSTNTNDSSKVVYRYINDKLFDNLELP